MNWGEFLAFCDPKVRPHFREAKTLVEAAEKSLTGKTREAVKEAGISRTPAYAIRVVTPDQKPRQTFLARLAAPNPLHFCFDH